MKLSPAQRSKMLLDLESEKHKAYEPPEPLPKSWELVGVEGVTAWRRRDGLLVLSSEGVEKDGKRWIHLSVSRHSRLPGWEDLKAVRNLWLGAGKTALQVIPPETDHVNIMEYCLHLWHCADGDVTPDFTRGLGVI